MVNLHVHSMFSLRDSIIKPADLAKRVSEIGQKAVAVTDHGGSLGGVTIYKELKAAGIKYIHGVEFYICDDVKIKDKDSKYYHLVALCKNDTGRLNMNRLITMSEHPDNKYFKPRIDFEMLKQHSDGLIIMSACLAGEVSKAIMSDEYDRAEQIARKYQEQFGDDYYIEIQSHSDPEQIKVNQALVALADHLGIEVVVTTDAHYAYEADRMYQNKYAFNGAYKEDGEAYVDCFLQSEREVRDRLHYFTPEQIDRFIGNTEAVSAKCLLEMPLSAPIMPQVDTPEQYPDNETWLHDICKRGFQEKLNIDYDTGKIFNEEKMLIRSILDDDGNEIDTEEYQLSQEQIQTYIERYQYEMNALSKMGFIDYIILVYSYANVGKRRGIARGSGGGSLVNYLSNITNIDPIEHGLYFERFIDVGALSKLESGEITAKELKIPDIDLDFSGESCAEVLQFLYNKYGEEHVASIGKFGTNKTKGTIRDLCKVFDLDLATADQIAKSFEHFEIEDIDAMIGGQIPISASAQDAIKNVKHYTELFDYVRKLNGLPKSFGLHACFTGDVLVTTKDGPTRIEDIRQGDLVLTKEGNYERVECTSKLLADNIVKISAVGTKGITCTEDHLFYVRHRLPSKNRKKIYSDPVWVPASEIQKRDMIAVRHSNVEKIPVYQNLRTDIEEFWWIIGRWFGDGWTEDIVGRNEVRTIICCGKTDSKDLSAIKRKLEYVGFQYRISEYETTFKFFLKGKEIFDFLQQFGKYAHNKHLTSDILDLPRDSAAAFLMGYFSADGYVNSEGFTEAKTVSYRLAVGLEQLISKVYKRHCGMRVIPAKTEFIEGREVSSKEKYDIYFSTYGRPKERCFYDGEFVWSFVKSVDSIPQETFVYDLTVANSHTYTANNYVVHNCGKVISTRNLDEFLPSCYDDTGVRFLQGDMHDVEDVGLVKIDVLGLRTLDQEYDTLEMSHQGMEFLDPKQRYTDPKVLDIFRKGDTLGIFQMASPGMKKTLKKMNVSGIEDISVANALFRPGSMQYIDNFCERKAGRESFEYLHPDLEPILRNTYGIIVFQEQLIEIGRLAKLHNPDLLRKATGKKNPKLLAQIKPELEEKLTARGWSSDQFEKLWADMLDFARYSFNKAHSSAYGIIAYMTAKQKAYYPAEFFAGLYNSYIGESSFVKDDASDIAADMMRHEVRIKKLSFRDDHRACSVKDGKIIYAIPLIRDSNLQTAEVLHKFSRSDEKFFWRLCRDMMQEGMGKSKLEVLVKLDFFDEFANSKKLLRILDFLEFFKNGERASVKKAQVESSEFLYNIVDRYSTSKNAKGDELKTFKIQNCDAILDELENYIKGLPLEDFDFKTKIATQREYLGFVCINTANDADRSKLMVKGVFPLHRKKDDALFGYSVVSQSMGSGKESRMTVFKRKFESDPIKEGDLIRCKKWTRDGQYFQMLDYEHIYS